LSYAQDVLKPQALAKNLGGDTSHLDEILEKYSVQGRPPAVGKPFGEELVDAAPSDLLQLYRNSVPFRGPTPAAICAEHKRAQQWVPQKEKVAPARSRLPTEVIPFLPKEKVRHLKMATGYGPMTGDGPGFLTKEVRAQARAKRAKIRIKARSPWSRLLLPKVHCRQSLCLFSSRPLRRQHQQGSHLGISSPEQELYQQQAR
jgi:hypothetical protein